jgi:hypothetical protein
MLVGKGRVYLFDKNLIEINVSFNIKMYVSGNLKDLKRLECNLYSLSVIKRCNI